MLEHALNLKYLRNITMQMECYIQKPAQEIIIRNETNMLDAFDMQPLGKFLQRPSPPHSLTTLKPALKKACSQASPLGTYSRIGTPECTPLCPELQLHLCGARWYGFCLSPFGPKQGIKLDLFGMKQAREEAGTPLYKLNRQIIAAPKGTVFEAFWAKSRLVHSELKIGMAFRRTYSFFFTMFHLLRSAF